MNMNSYCNKIVRNLKIISNFLYYVHKFATRTSHAFDTAEFHVHYGQTYSPASC